MRVRATMVVLALAWACAGPLRAQSPTDLIDSVIAAYGGREALGSVVAYEMHGAMTSRMSGARATAVRTFARPGRLRVVLHYPQRVEVRILDGDRGWRGDQRGMSAASGPMLAAMQLQAARAALPWILDERRAEVAAIGPLDVEGNLYPGLELALAEGLTLRAYVDPATHYIVKSETLMAVRGMRTSFETMYAGFREVEGVVFAFWEQNFASGMHTGSTMLDSVVVNPVLGPEVFRP